MSEFYSIKRTRTKKKKILLWMDEIDYKKLEKLPPFKTISVQEKIRQILKAFLHEEDDFIDKKLSGEDDDLEGL